MSPSRLAVIAALSIGLAAAPSKAQGSGSSSPAAELVDAGTAVAIDAGTTPDAAGPAIGVAPTFVIDAAHPLESAVSAWTLVKQQGWVWGGAAVLLALGVILAKKNDETHWIHNPYLLTGGTAALALLAAVINVHFGSASWTSVLPILFGAIGLIFKKPEPKTA